MRDIVTKGRKRKKNLMKHFGKLKNEFQSWRSSKHCSRISDLHWTNKVSDVGNFTATPWRPASVNGGLEWGRWWRPSYKPESTADAGVVLSAPQLLCCCSPLLISWLSTAAFKVPYILSGLRVGPKSSTQNGLKPLVLIQKTGTGKITVRYTGRFSEIQQSI